MRRAATFLLLALVACTATGGTLRIHHHTRPSAPTPSAPTPSASSPSTRHEARTPLITGSAAEAMQRLCTIPPRHKPKVRRVRHVPPIVSETEHEVESVRGLRYLHPVAVDAETHTRLVRGVNREFEHSLPQGHAARQTLALQTVGALPRETTLRRAVHRFLSTQIIGYYDTDSKQLVYMGTHSPTPKQRYILAHELTHALDDQHFDLSRLDPLTDQCRNEELQAATGVVEGSAVNFSQAVVYQFFSPDVQPAAFSRSGSGPTGIPPFTLNMNNWPYIAGPQFIRALYYRGGLRLVNRALRHWPVTTEQVIHPDRYPRDRPTPLGIPQLAPKLGKGWRDLDVEEVGEEWLTVWLGLRLDSTEASAAADGWDGGLFRAWRNGGHVAVVMRTAWDRSHGAEGFVHAVRDWVEPHEHVKVRWTGNRRVNVLFATDGATLRVLQRASRPG